MKRHTRPLRITLDGQTMTDDPFFWRMSKGRKIALKKRFKGKRGALAKLVFVRWIELCHEGLHEYVTIPSAATQLYLTVYKTPPRDLSSVLKIGAEEGNIAVIDNEPFERTLTHRTCVVVRQCIRHFYDNTLPDYCTLYVRFQYA